MARTPEERAKQQEQREVDGARAMAEYRAEQKAERDKTARLRAARLAREAAAPAKTKSKAGAKPKTKA
jgi:hypothetical protein